MTQQPEALRLADDLDRNCEMGWGDYDTQMGAAAELRRLHEVNQELLEALKGFSDYVRNEKSATDGAVTYSTTHINHWAFLARAAIAKATGEKP